MSLAMLGLEALLILFFGSVGLMKVLAHPHMVGEFEKFGYPYWLARLAGTVECVAVAMLVTGLWNPPLGAAGSLLLVCVMTGATYINFAKRPRAFGLGTLGILVLCLLPLIYHFGSLSEALAE